MTSHNKHGRAVTAAYDLGWSEGWNAALARVQELGIDEVLAREAAMKPEPDEQLALAAKVVGDGREP